MVGQVRTCEVKLGQVILVKTGQGNFDEVKLIQDKSSQDGTGPVKLGMVKSARSNKSSVVGKKEFSILKI